MGRTRKQSFHSSCSRRKANKKIRKRGSVAPSPDESVTVSTVSKTKDTVIPINLPRKLSMTRERRVFGILLTLAMVIGMSVPPLMFHSRTAYNVLKVWCAVVFRIRTVFMIMVCVYNYLFWPSLALRYSYFIHCLIGYAVLVIFRLKGQEITDSVERIINVSSRFQSKATHRWSWVGTYMLLSFSCFVVFYALGAYFFFYVFWDDYIEKLTALTQFSKDSVLLRYYNWMVLFGVLASYHMSSATLYVTSFLCGLSYRMLGDFFHVFGKRLRNDVSRAPLMTYTLRQNLVRFKDIIYSIRATDTALNMAAAAVYAAVINGAYIVLSLVLSQESRFRRVEVELIWVMISIASILKFYFLTMSGDYIVRQRELLNYDLIGITDIVLNLSSITTVHMFSLLTANIRTINVHVTGFNYFKITRKIILRVIGVMVTYGSWINEIGAYADL